jgi:hypothetical protein
MYKTIVRALLICVFCATVLDCLTLAFVMNRGNVPGRQVDVILFLAAACVAPMIAIGSVLLGVLVVLGYDKLGVGDRLASMIFAACGFIPVVAFIIIYCKGNAGQPM